jgi:hypothetical protein
MAVPWLRLLDAFIGVTDLARSRRIGKLGQAEGSELATTSSRALGHIETRLVGAVVAALKEAFDRDSRRLELEREHLEAERERAERALRLELARQNSEREMGRLRLLAAVAAASWMVTLLLAARLISGGTVAARTALGAGWVLLLAALAFSFVEQSRLTSAMGRIDQTFAPPDRIGSGLRGALAPWLIVAGLALVGLAVLL